MIKIVKNKGKEPVIYIRYYKGEILYIGETGDSKGGRPFRYDNQGAAEIGSWDKVRLLKASSHSDKRKLWEAWLICKLKPKNQKVHLYQRIVDKNKKHGSIKNKKELKPKVTPEMLDELIKKNNKEKLSFWLDQYEYATTALKDSGKMAMHFYLCYKQDNKNINDKEK
tara:strand:+ start:293 stop:796 length:504 start_codon:yes stop_codon:yes gene_type:complete